MTSSDTEEYDDLSDLDTMEMESVREWEMQFKGTVIFEVCSSFCSTIMLRSRLTFENVEKYEYVGRLLRPGEEPNSYSDEEEESSETPAAKANKTDEDIKNLNSSSTAATDKPKDE